MESCVCNVVIDKSDIDCSLLLQSSNSNGIVIVKSKSKTVYVSHVIFELVNLSFLKGFLRISNQQQ